MDTKQVLVDVLGGKKFKVVPSSPLVYFFHWPLTKESELQVYHGNSNTKKGMTGLSPVHIIQKHRSTLISFYDKTYTVLTITISFDRTIKAEVVLKEKKTGKILKLREDGKI